MYDRNFLRIVGCGNIETPRTVGMRIEYGAIPVFFYKHGDIIFRIAKKAEAFASVGQDSKPCFISYAGRKGIFCACFGADRFILTGFSIVQVYRSAFHGFSR